MSDPLPFRRSPDWRRLRPDEAEREIRRRARETRNVVLTDHALERIAERSILPADVYRILQSGLVEGTPEMVAEGEWKIVMVKRMPGTRQAGVVTAIAQDDDLVVVVTVEWMDWLR